MESLGKRIAPLCLLVFLLTACDRFEMRGFLFAYETADERFKQSLEWNKTVPFLEEQVSSDDYVVCVMGDSHVGGTENLDLFLKEAKRLGAAATVMAGDLTNGHHDDFINFQNHLPSQEEMFLFVMVGNHDLFFDGWKQFYSMFGSSTYYFTIKTPKASDLYICTDTGSGTLGSEQLEWLKDVLSRERSKYRHCTLFTHNNLFRIRHTSSTNPFVEELRVLVEMCIEHQIDMVVAGHDHEKNAVMLGNTTHITMDALEDGFHHAGYLNLYIRNSGIDYEFVRF